MKRILWGIIETQFLIEVYPDHKSENIAKVLNCNVRRIYNKANLLNLNKSQSFLSSESSGRIKLPGNKAKLHQFKKGQKPFNTGKKWSEFMTEKGRNSSFRTTFKKGNLPHNTKSDGEISIRNDDGRKYKYIRLRKAVWKPLHVHVWERENGSVPAGMIVVFKDRDTINCEPDNLELITREENMNRNSFHRYPRELKFTIRKLKQLKRTIYEKQNR